VSHLYPAGAPTGFEKQEINRFECLTEGCDRDTLEQSDEYCEKCRQCDKANCDNYAVEGDRYCRDCITHAAKLGVDLE